MDAGGYWTWANAKSAGADYNEVETARSEWPDGSLHHGTDGSVCPWGWRLPITQDISDLIGRTDTSVGSGSGVANLVGTSGSADYGLQRTGDDGNTLFFKAAGLDGPSGNGIYGRYWSSTHTDNSYAISLRFVSGSPYGQVRNDLKSAAFSVRCVRSK